MPSPRWTVQFDLHPPTLCIVDPNGASVVEIDVLGLTPTPEEEHTAWLLAAAPRLYDALENLTARLYHEYPEGLPGWLSGYMVEAEGALLSVTENPPLTQI